MASFINQNFRYARYTATDGPSFPGAREQIAPFKTKMWLIFKSNQTSPESAFQKLKGNDLTSLFDMFAIDPFFVTYDT